MNQLSQAPQIEKDKEKTENHSSQYFTPKQQEKHGKIIDPIHALPKVFQIRPCGFSSFIRKEMVLEWRQVVRKIRVLGYSFLSHFKSF